MSNKPKRNYAATPNKINKVDICQTPPHAIEPLLPLLDKNWWIWESAAGPERLLANTLGKYGFVVHATDLLYSEQYNYLTYTPDFYYDVEITNVPFSLKYRFIEKALERNKPFAYIVPYETTAAKKAQELSKQFGVKFQALAPERRINFKMPNVGWGKEVWSEEKGFYYSGGSAQMATMWLTWQMHVERVYAESLYVEVYAVPMRSAKYDDDNTEKI